MKTVEYGMRRDDDIENAVNKQYKKVAKWVASNPPEHIYFSMQVYWTRKAVYPFEKYEPVEIVLQDALEGKSMDEFLQEYGRKAALIAREEKRQIPQAIVISTEMIMANNREPHSEGKQKVIGIPMFVVAGRTENGRQNVRMESVALTPLKKDANGNVLPPELQPPPKMFLGKPAPPDLAGRVESMRELISDFLAPFFEGFRNGDDPKTSLTIIR